MHGLQEIISMNDGWAASKECAKLLKTPIKPRPVQGVYMQGSVRALNQKKGSK